MKARAAVFHGAGKPLEPYATVPPVNGCPFTSTVPLAEPLGGPVAPPAAPEA